MILPEHHWSEKKINQVLNKIYVGVFWCKSKEFTKKNQSPQFPPPLPPASPSFSLPPPWNLTKIIIENESWLMMPNDSSKFFFRQYIIWLVYQISDDFGRKLNFVRILCIWLFWKSLTWLVYQISGDFGRKLNFVRILCIWLFWKNLTWLVY